VPVVSDLAPSCTTGGTPTYPTRWKRCVNRPEQRCDDDAQCADSPSALCVDKPGDPGAFGKLSRQTGKAPLSLLPAYGYYGITGNSVAITRFRHEVRRRWWKWLSRRGGRSYLSWVQFARLEERYLLPAAIAVHSSYRRAANP
jgi:hypothetical protein